MREAGDAGSGSGWRKEGMRHGDGQQLFCGAARNQLLRRARGQVDAGLDGDDIHRKERGSGRGRKSKAEMQS